MICPKCNAMLPNNAYQCTKCGLILQTTNNNQYSNTNNTASSHLIQPTQAPYPDSQVQHIPNYQQQYNVKPKKSGNGCIIAIVVIIGVFFMFGFIPALFRYINKSESVQTETTQTVIMDESESEETTTETVTEQVIQFKPETIYNDEDIDVSITSYEEENNQPILGLEINNKSNKDYEIYSFYSSINDIMEAGGSDEESILAGKTLKTKIKYRSTEYELYDIGTIYNITLFMSLKSGDNTISTDAHSFVIRDGKQPLSGDLLYENDYYSVYKISSSSDLKENYIRIENKSDSFVQTSITDTSVNENMFEFDTLTTMAYGFWTFSGGATTIPGKSSIFKISLNDDKLNEKGIESVDKIEFKISGSTTSDTQCDSDIITIQ